MIAFAWNFKLRKKKNSGYLCVDDCAYMHACMREAWVCVRSWMSTYVCACACHMCAWDCDVSVSHVFACSSVFFFHCKYKKIGAWFLQFSHFLKHILAVYLDTKQRSRQMCSPSCYDWWPLGNHGVLKCFSRISVSFSRHLDSSGIFFLVKMTCSLSLSLLCLSVCLSKNLSLRPWQHKASAVRDGCKRGEKKF